MNRNDVTQWPRSICSGCNPSIYRHSRGGKRESNSSLKIVFDALNRLAKLDARLRGHDGKHIDPAQALARADGAAGKGLLP